VTDALDRLAAALADRYTIERELGQGGMATIYLAEDLRHHRKVALKVLRPEIAATLGAGRFAREIEVAARLQHPNILPLLDSGEAAGFFFYVMPYVEGESLRDRLARGGELPIHDAVRILMEVADALSEAHAHGVVHRDIKPDNVLLRGRHALVADFGVAKAVTEATGRQVLTSAGVALGTPAYMAPEQATADPRQDHRVDIYALGVLGYELLTGRPPFSATTAQEMLAAHVTAEPEPLEQYRPTVSPALAAVLMQCLAKKPADRWQTADELLAALEPLATPSGGITPTQARPMATFGRVPRWGRWAAAVGALGALGGLAYTVLRPKPLAVALADMSPVTTESGVQFEPAISPDGKLVAYAAGPITAPHLVIRSTAGMASAGEVRLADTSFTSEWYPSWTDDGESVRFWGCRSQNCAMYVTDKLGGSVRFVRMPARIGLSLSRTTWSPDGSRVAYVADDTIFAASTGDTTLRLVVVDTAGRFGELNSLAWSPDARFIAYVLSNPSWRATGNVETSSIWLVSATGRTPQRVTTADHLNVSPVWVDARHLLFVSDRDGPRAAYVVEVDAKGSHGVPRAVPGVADPHSLSYSIQSATLTFSKLTFQQNIWAYPIGRSSPVSIRAGRPVTAGAHVIEAHDVSPDGKWIVFDDSRRGEASDLFRMPTTGGEPVQLTDLPGLVDSPQWSPDGSEIAFTWYGPTAYRNMVVPAGGGAALAITDSLDYNGFPQWSPTGLRIAYKSSRTGRAEVYVVSRDSVGAPWRPPVRITDFGCFVSAWSTRTDSILCVSHGDVISISRQGRILWRRGILPASGLTSASGFSPEHSRLSRDGRTFFVEATDRGGRRGVWAIPIAGGPPHLVVAYDDPALVSLGAFLSLGPNSVYLTVGQYEGHIWVGKLRW
jgi:eukaryotic-like serine/threonine-protein kinase